MENFDRQIFDTALISIHAECLTFAMPDGSVIRMYDREHTAEECIEVVKKGNPQRDILVYNLLLN